MKSILFWLFVFSCSVLIWMYQPKPLFIPFAPLVATVFFLFHVTCQRILRRRFDREYFQFIAEFNRLEFPALLKSLEGIGPPVGFSRLRIMLERDFLMLTLLLKFLSPHQHYSNEVCLLILYFRWQFLLLAVTHFLRSGEKQTILRLISVLQYFANAVSRGERELSVEAGSDYLLELILHNLGQLGQAPRAAFLQRLLRGLTSVEVSEKESVVHWERILARRNELAEKLGRQVFLRTAAVDYFGELHLLRKPILLEYEELEKLRHNAATDPLTGLKNRRTFEEHLGREINRARRYGSSFSMLLLDLRRFKRANDTYGHAVGDEILRSVARASAETIRGADISCRIGGDEFAILLPQADRSSAEAFAERIARKFESYARPLAPETPVGVDYGIAIFPEDGEDATRLLEFANKELCGRKAVEPHRRE